MSKILSRAIKLASTYKSYHWRDFASELLEKKKFNLERSIDFISTPHFQKEIVDMQNKRVPALSIPEPGIDATRAEITRYNAAAGARKTRISKYFSDLKRRLRKYIETDYAAHVKETEMEAAVCQIEDTMYDGNLKLAEQHYLLT